jgi:hypothetical protein
LLLSHFCWIFRQTRQPAVSQLRPLHVEGVRGVRGVKGVRGVPATELVEIKEELERKAKKIHQEEAKVFPFS